MSKKLAFSIVFSSVLAGSAFAATIEPVAPQQDSDKCFLVSSAAELFGLSDAIKSSSTMDPACVKLTKDIVINEKVLNADGSLNSESSADFVNWTPIPYFSGSFDGQGHTISGMYAPNSTGTNMGLFAALTGGSDDSPVVVKNTKIADSYFNSTLYVGPFGALISKNAVAEINGCSFSGTIVGRYIVGGLVARVDNSKLHLSNSRFDGNLTAVTNAGGLVGQVFAGSLVLENNLVTGTVNISSSASTSQATGVKAALGNLYSGSAELYNNYYLKSPQDKEYTGAFAVTAEQLAGGDVNTSLAVYGSTMSADASIWGEKTATTSAVKLHTYSGDAAKYMAEYVPGVAMSLPRATREGYVFDGWFTADDYTGFAVTSIPATATGTQEYWAKFSKINTVSFDVTGGTIDSGLVETYVEGVGASLPKKVSRSGYAFVGWYKDGDATKAVVDSITTATTGNQKFVAKWFEVTVPKKGADGCYEISTASELYGYVGIFTGDYGVSKVNSANSRCGKLTADIEVNSKLEKGAVPWKPLDAFNEVFDGQGHTISGVYMNDTSIVRGALFGLVTGGSATKPVTIKNLTLANSLIRVNYYAGGIIAATSTTTTLRMENVHSAATVYSKNGYAASLVSVIDGTSSFTLVNCYNTGDISGVLPGGLVSELNSKANLILANCYNLGTVKPTSYSSYKSLVRMKNGTLTIFNSFYLKSAGNSEYGGYAATQEQFENGLVAALLHDGADGYDGSAWGQKVGVDKYPVLSGTITGSKAVSHQVTFHTFEEDANTYFDHYYEGVAKDLPAKIEREGYTFMGWYDNAEMEGTAVTSISASASKDVEFWAKLRKVYSVTLNTNGGKIASGNVVAYTQSVGATLPKAVTQDGKVFLGWFENEDLSGVPVKTITVADEGDKVYYAKWFDIKVPEVAEDGCYKIWDEAELYGFAAIVNGTSGMKRERAACGLLLKDVFLNHGVIKEDGTLDSSRMDSFMPWTVIDTLMGDFNGASHVITGLYVNDTTKSNLGFARVAGGNANGDTLNVKNLFIVGSFVQGKENVGALFGSVRYGTALKMESVRTDHNVVVGAGRVGGQVGYAYGSVLAVNGSNDGTVALDPDRNGLRYGFGGIFGSSNNSLVVKNYENMSDVSGSSYVGGFVGFANGTVDITECSNKGRVTGVNAGTAGLVGYSNATTLVTKSYNLGTISGYNHVGAIAGHIENSASVLDQNYNEGLVTGNNYVGGILGYSRGSMTVSNSYNIASVTGNNYVGGVVGYAYISAYTVELALYNTYNMGEVTAKTQNYDLVMYTSRDASKAYTESFGNNYYLAVDGEESHYGTAMEKVAFEDETVTNLLHDYTDTGVDGSMWVQDSIPVLLINDIFTISYQLNGGTMKDYFVWYKYGDEKALPVPTREGYTFRGWYTKTNPAASDVPVEKITKKTLGNQVFYAIWDVLKFKVTVAPNVNYMGTVEGGNKNEEYSYGATLSLTANAADGYYFTDWEVDVADILSEKQRASESISIAVKNDMNIVANFAKIEISSSSVAVSSSSVAESSSSEAKSSSSTVESSSSVPSSSSVTESSSSEKVSSSSVAESSSSEMASSSSVAESSSSEAESSSSVESSSSSVEESSSSEEDDAIVAVAGLPKFSLTANNRNIQVAGASMGRVYAVMDMQGRVLIQGRVDAPDFEITLNRTGTFFVRIGTQSRMIRVK